MKKPKRNKNLQESSNNFDITSDLDSLLDSLAEEQTKAEVKLEVDDVEVEGIAIHRSESDFGLVIIKPYYNLSTGSHIPNFTRDVLSFKSEYGDNNVKACLRYLYELGKYLAEEMDFLKAKLAASEDNLPADSFFEENFPMPLPFETKFQVLDILKGNRELIS